MKVKSVLMCHVMLRVVSRTSCPAAKKDTLLCRSTIHGRMATDNRVYCRAGRPFLKAVRPHTCRNRIYVVEVTLPI